MTTTSENTVDTSVYIVYSLDCNVFYGKKANPLVRGRREILGVHL